MTEAERDRSTITQARTHEADWVAYLGRPRQDRAADQVKVEATYQQHGVQAARDMMVALGMPLPPEGLCTPANATSYAAWMSEATAEFGASDAEIEEALMQAAAGRVDH